MVFGILTDIDSRITAFGDNSISSFRTLGSSRALPFVKTFQPAAEAIVPVAVDTPFVHILETYPRLDH